jgi:hypothetical protein
MAIESGISGEAGDRTSNNLRHVERVAIQPDLSGHDAFDVEEVVDEVREVADLTPDHLARADSGAVLRVHALEHADRAPDRAKRIAQLVSQHRQKLVFPAAVALGAVAFAARFEELAEIGHDQRQVGDSLRRHGRGE